MNELAVEWVEKAKGDYATAGRKYRYAVRCRYPGESANKDEARLVFRAVKVVRAFVREKLGISDAEPEE